MVKNFYKKNLVTGAVTEINEGDVYNVDNSQFELSYYKNGIKQKCLIGKELRDVQKVFYNIHLKYKKYLYKFIYFTRSVETKDEFLQDYLLYFIDNKAKYVKKYHLDNSLSYYVKHLKYYIVLCFKSNKLTNELDDNIVTNDNEYIDFSSHYGDDYEASDKTSVLLDFEKYIQNKKTTKSCKKHLLYIVQTFLRTGEIVSLTKLFSNNKYYYEKIFYEIINDFVKEYHLELA